jgi:gamma-polyglutamate synthase
LYETVLTILVITLSLFVFYLFYERRDLERLRKSVPLIIAVTGTRGKSTVVRLLASVLRESGRIVLAKTTGSQAQYVLPDGSIERVHRRGLVSILEQKNSLRKAVKLKADCLVVEIMSIRPENHIVESQRILKPDIVVLTNIRKDHTEAMGEQENDIAQVLQLDFAAGSRVYLPKECEHYLDSKIIEKQHLSLTVVPANQAHTPVGSQSALLKNEFSENLDLVGAVSNALNIGDEVIARGIRNAKHDIGRFKIWVLQLNGKKIFAVNAFAANDPESTMKVLGRTEELLGRSVRPITGLLNLRSDRPDRTLQWIDALNLGLNGKFTRLYVLGGHANVVKRKTDATTLLASKPPDVLTQLISETMEENSVLFGFGNIAGAGEGLIEFWQREGKEYGI